jgi:hypothetical protein
MMQANQNLSEIRDQDAYVALALLLKAAVADIQGLGVQPVVIASCPLKFNDAGNDEDWRAIRAGDFLSERSDYFEDPGAHERRMCLAPEYARTAERALERLETANWRGLYQKTFAREDMSVEEVIAIVLQDSKIWLVVNGSNSGESAVYSIGTDGNCIHVGRCSDGKPRFDQGLGERPPLSIRWKEEDAADRAAALYQIEELGHKPKRALPDWYRQTHARWVRWRIAGDAPSLGQRLDTLAETGRVSREEYERLAELIVRCGDR